MWRSEVSLEDCSSRGTHLDFGSMVSYWELTYLAGQGAPAICPSVTLGLQACATVISSLLGFWGSTPGPHGCMASTLPTDLPHRCVSVCVFIPLSSSKQPCKGVLVLSLRGDGKIEAQESQVTWLKLGSWCAMGLRVQPAEAGPGVPAAQHRALVLRA